MQKFKLQQWRISKFVTKNLLEKYQKLRRKYKCDFYFKHIIIKKRQYTQ